MRVFCFWGEVFAHFGSEPAHRRLSPCLNVGIEPIPGLLGFRPQFSACQRQAERSEPLRQLTPHPRTIAKLQKSKIDVLLPFPKSTQSSTPAEGEAAGRYHRFTTLCA
jgi:hypothetical protein